MRISIIFDMQGMSKNLDDNATPYYAEEVLKQGWNRDQTVRNCNRLKFRASDGNMRMTDIAKSFSYRHHFPRVERNDNPTQRSPNGFRQQKQEAKFIQQLTAPLFSFLFMNI